MFARMKLSMKLISSFSLVAVITLVVGFIGWNGSTQLKGNIQEIANVRLPSVQGLYILKFGIERVVVTQRTLLEESLTPRQRDELHDQVGAARAIYQEGWDLYAPLPQTKEESRVWDDFVATIADWKEENSQVFAMSEQVQELSRSEGNEEKIAALLDAMSEQAMGICVEKQKVALGLLDRVVAINLEVSENEKTEALANAARTSTVAIIGMVVGTILALSLGIFLSRSISRALNRIVEGLKGGSNQVASASEQLASSSQSMSEGASEQASSLEEVSSSLEEMASMTKQNAGNAKQANATSSEAANAAAQGVEAMRRMAEAINRIKSSSDETAKIIKTIDEIAMQTNLLALNAAVEAARAGEAGRGFAVVAEEVRNLAQRSAEAAKNTADLIQGSQQNAENGVAVSGEVAEILDKITDGVQKVAQLIAEVSGASNEQSQGIDQVNSAVAQMDQVTQQNAANAEESASASEELSSQAQNLNSMVEELVTLVGGSASQEHGSMSVGSGVRTVRPAGNSRDGNSLKANTLQRQSPVRHEGPRNGSSSVRKPEEVIPLDADEESLKEF